MVLAVGNSPTYRGLNHWTPAIDAPSATDHVPLSIRYDVTEKVHRKPFPHLFARKVGIRQEVLSGHYLRGSSASWQWWPA